jgi:hypothetical protein
MKSNLKTNTTNIPDEWITHYEKSGFTESPRYKETINYFNNFAEKTNNAKIVSIGSSTQGRKQPPSGTKIGKDGAESEKPQNPVNLN